MELKSKASLILEVTKGEKTYRFDLPAGSPFGEAYDAAHMVLEAILKMANEAAEKVAENKELHFKTDEEENNVEGDKENS